MLHDQRMANGLVCIVAHTAPAGLALWRSQERPLAVCVVLIAMDLLLIRLRSTSYRRYGITAKPRSRTLRQDQDNGIYSE